MSTSNSCGVLVIIASNNNPKFLETMEAGVALSTSLEFPVMAADWREMSNEHIQSLGIIGLIVVSENFILGSDFDEPETVMSKILEKLFPKIVPYEYIRSNKAILLCHDLEIELINEVSTALGADAADMHTYSTRQITCWPLREEKRDTGLRARRQKLLI